MLVLCAKLLAGMDSHTSMDHEEAHLRVQGLIDDALSLKKSATENNADATSALLTLIAELDDEDFLTMSDEESVAEESIHEDPLEAHLQAKRHKGRDTREANSASKKRRFHDSRFFFQGLVCLG